MNPLKTLFNKVFDSNLPIDQADVSKEDAPFEWNLEEESVAPTSAKGISWNRGNNPANDPLRVPAGVWGADTGGTAHSVPTSLLEKNTPITPRPAVSQAPKPRSLWDESPPPPVAAAPLAPASVDWAPISPLPAPPPVAPAPVAWGPISPPPAVAASVAWGPVAGEASFISVKPLAPASSPQTPPSQGRATSENWVRPSVPELTAPFASSLPAPAPSASPLSPLSDFEEVYRKAGIKSPVHGYGVERVYRLLTSRRLVNLDRSIRRSALLTALDAAGVPQSDVSQDAVLRRKALTAYEAEKALELQSLRSRNESRAEALQDTVATFTRQKQTQIERLSQGSTSAVRAQSDLEIRKRMEQDRLHRSLAYFVEPLPPPTVEVRRELPEPPRVIETIDTRRDANTEIRPLAPEVTPPPPEDVEVSSPDANTAERAETAVDAVTVRPAEDSAADTQPAPKSGLELALKAAAEEARIAGWGRAAIVEDSAGDAVDALRRLREAKKTEPDS